MADPQRLAHQLLAGGVAIGRAGAVAGVHVARDLRLEDLVARANAWAEERVEESAALGLRVVVKQPGAADAREAPDPVEAAAGWRAARERIAQGDRGHGVVVLEQALVGGQRKHGGGERFG